MKALLINSKIPMLLKFLIHICVIIAVILIPPLFYDFFNGSFLGALTYLFYFGYWCLKIKDHKLRLVTYNVLLVLTTVMIILFTAKCKSSSIIVFLYFFSPLIVGLIATPIMLKFKMPKSLRKTYLINIGITLLITTIFFVNFIGVLGLCCMSYMSW